MKLIYCYKCRDVVALIPERVRQCQCGESRGRYVRSDDSATYRLAEVEGPLVVIGIVNADLFNDRRGFRAHRIAPSDQWLKWIGAPPREGTRTVHDKPRRYRRNTAALAELTASGEAIDDRQPAWRSTYVSAGHPLDGQPVTRRESGLLEVSCVHGIGHPMHESVMWMDAHGSAGSRGTWGVHSCDGCCRGIGPK